LEAAADDVRQQSKASFGILSNAYSLACETLVGLTELGQTSPVTVTDTQSIRISITANLIQSATVPGDLISSGFYWAASAILRQHMEALARVIELRSGSFSESSKSPQVALLPFKLNQNYGRLSELAHLSRGEFLADFAQFPGGDETIASTKPVFRKELAHDLFSVHLAHSAALIVEVHLLNAELYPDRPPVDVNGPLEGIAGALVSTGFWGQPA
jgi:hypothetical protein